MANAATHRRKPGPREAEQLQALAQAPETEPRMRERAKLILHWMEGETPDEIVQKTGMSRSMVFRWRARYNQEGVQGLMDRPRTGKPRVYDEDFERRTLALLQQEPPAPMAFWTASALARRLEALCGALYLLGGNPPDSIMTIAGPGTILCAACMGPLIDWFNRRVSIPLLHRQAA